MTPVVLLFQMCYIVPSILLYLSIILYLLLSKDPEFNSAFHSIFMLRAPADLLQVAVSLVAFRLPIAGWQAVLDYSWVAKAGFVLSQYACLLELFAQLMLSLNRLTAIAFPMMHRWMWSTRSTLIVFLCCACVAVLPTAARLSQPAGYLEVNGSVVPRLFLKQDQKINSSISCAIYLSFCLTCLCVNLVSICILSKQSREKLFDQQHRLAMRVQTNLLIYSCTFTLSIAAMTVCQCLLALQLFPASSPSYPIIVISLTVAADAFALSNPWLLLLLSAPFRQKFLSAKSLPKMFDRSTTST